MLPDPVAPTVTWLNATVPVTSLVGARIATKLPEVDSWPAIRIDPTGGAATVEDRIDQARLQIQCFAMTDAEAMLVARTTRAALAAMAGYRQPGVVVVTDVTTTSPQLIETVPRNPAMSREPPISHATFSAVVTVRPDP